MKPDPATFWNKKILGWEKSKYAVKPGLKVFDVNSSLKSRMDLARSILKELAPGRRIVELGCGSALLMEDIIEFGAKSYTGIDISNVAIDEAKKRATNKKIDNVELVSQKISELQPIKADICFSLGLLDWLSLFEISEVPQKIETQFYFHTFSEKKLFSYSQFLHRMYVYLMYGRKTGEYIPNYYSETQIVNALSELNSAKPQFLRRKNLSFGCLAYQFPNSIVDKK